MVKKTLHHQYLEGLYKQMLEAKRRGFGETSEFKENFQAVKVNLEIENTKYVRAKELDEQIEERRNL